MKNLTFVYLNPLHFGRPLPLATLFPGEAPVVWLEDPRFFLYSASWLDGAWGLRPWRSMHWGHDLAETAMRREWLRLDVGDRPRLVVCPGEASWRRALAFAARHGLPHEMVEAVPGEGGWHLEPAASSGDTKAEKPVDALFFPLELRGAVDPEGLAELVHDLSWPAARSWPAALCGLVRGRPGTWFHAHRDGTLFRGPARASCMMADVPEELYGWWADDATGPVLQAVMTVVADPAELWTIEAAIAARLAEWARERPALAAAFPASIPRPKALARRQEEHLHAGETVAGLTLARTAAALDPTAARLEELARWYNRVDDYGHAVGLVEAALALSPEDRSLLANRVRLQVAYGDWDRAAVDLESARRVGDDPGLDLLGFQVAEGRGDLPGALAEGRVLAARFTGREGKKHDRHSRTDFFLAFAGVCLASGEYAEGLDAVYAAVALEPDHPGTYFLAALMLCGALQWEDALGELEKASRCGNDASWVSFVEVLANVGAGRTEEALVAARECRRRIIDELEHDGDYGPTLETRLLLAAFSEDEDDFRETTRLLADHEFSPEGRFQVRLLRELVPDFERLPWPESSLHG